MLEVEGSHPCPWQVRLASNCSSLLLASMVVVRELWSRIADKVWGMELWTGGENAMNVGGTDRSLLSIPVHTYKDLDCVRVAFEDLESEICSGLAQAISLSAALERQL